VASTDLKLDEPGTLPRPGPVGRSLRFALGLLCVSFISGLLDIRGNLVGGHGHVRELLWNGILPSLFLISYVINIGYSRSWKKWPAVVSTTMLLTISALGYLLDGSFESAVFARALWTWELYVFGHLGVSFLLAALIGTPGCEMRALHDLYSRISGTPTKEHYCPVGPLNPVDQWEGKRTR
jgi:hypothetical protein